MDQAFEVAEFPQFGIRTGPSPKFDTTLISIASSFAAPTDSRASSKAGNPFLRAYRPINVMTILFPENLLRTSSSDIDLIFGKKNGMSMNLSPSDGYVWVSRLASLEVET